MPRLWTAGYEGLTPDVFLAMLRSAGIDVLVDVRKFAYSRKPGFSKAALAASLEREGIAYRHLVDLGNPLKGEQKSGPVDYRAVYDAHLDTTAAQTALHQLAGLSCDGRVAILCFEKNACDCHRSLIAARLAHTHGFEIVDLAPASPQTAFAF